MPETMPNTYGRLVDNTYKTPFVHIKHNMRANYRCIGVCVCVCKVESHSRWFTHNLHKPTLCQDEKNTYIFPSKPVYFSVTRECADLVCRINVTSRRPETIDMFIITSVWRKSEMFRARTYSNNKTYAYGKLACEYSRTNNVCE